MPLGPAQAYIVRFNGYQLPGYVQNEDIPSTRSIGQHSAPYADASRSEYTGLENKNMSLTLKVWEPSYLECKLQVAKAATMLHSKKEGFASLYVQYSDRYYEAMVASVKEGKVAGSSVRTLDYDVEFETKPWLTAVSGYTITGTTTLDTDTVTRTIDNGGWTPTIITLTGTDVTISGFTSDGQLAGFISVSGAVTNLIIDTENFTATEGGLNRNNAMYSIDYRMYVGPGKTSYVATGASAISIFYRDRWYL